MAQTPAHYNQEYFAWQEPIGEFGGWANLPMFEQYVKDGDDVLEFGCGGGYLLKNLRCGRRMGVEINPAAAARARENGVEVYQHVGDVDDECADVVISNNALEHVIDPFNQLRALFQKLRKGGMLVIVVPCESISNSYRPEDVNHHLYSWSPMNLGNIITEAGFELVESRPFINKWPPKFQFVAKITGRRLFQAISSLYGHLDRTWFQVRAVATRANVVQGREE